jgi:Uma2 family endonuclease
MARKVGMPKATVDQLKAPGEWPAQGLWTYDDYLRLPSDGWRYEVIRGELYMNPAPQPKHQRVVLKLAGHLDRFVEEHDLGHVYVAPIDVLLAQLATPIQPDILFVSKSRLLIVEKNVVRGPPDFIAEVLSPSNAREDRHDKKGAYAEAGVREYWIVDPGARSIEAHVLDGVKYRRASTALAEEKVRSTVIEGFETLVGDVCPL